MIMKGCVIRYNVIMEHHKPHEDLDDAHEEHFRVDEKITLQ